MSGHVKLTYTYYILLSLHEIKKYKILKGGVKVPSVTMFCAAIDDAIAVNDIAICMYHGVIVSIYMSQTCNLNIFTNVVILCM